MLRREFLQRSVEASIATLPGMASFATGHSMTQSELCDLTAVAAIEAMRRGDISAEAYAKALLARCESYNALNAFISLKRARVLEGARNADVLRRSGKTLGLLHGLPLPVKDTVNSVDLPTSAGTGALRSFRPAANAPILESLLSAGAILLGKTNLHELGLGVTSNNLTFGPCHNPYDPSRSPGGSSGGSAVAVSTRMAPLAVGEDTTCSIRVPAAMCGVAGWRPSTGRYSQAGIMPITPRFDSVGPLARSVADLVLFDQVLLHDTQPVYPRPLRHLRLGVPSTYWNGLDEQIERVTVTAIEKLRDAGAEIVRVNVPEVIQSDMETVMDILSYEVVANETAFLHDQSAGVSFEQLFSQMSAPLRSRFETAFMAGGKNAVPEERYHAAIQRTIAIRVAMQEYFQQNNLAAMVFPPTLVPALPIGVEGEITIRGAASTVRTAMLRNTVHASCVGMPGLVLPAGMTVDGLPVGLEFDVLPGDDRSLLPLGLSLERVLGPVAAPSGAHGLATNKS
jgi:Asp-tRNA(Asn)/Glu-tRNA(Gln) amidotransferase A subunit family amidase